MRPAVTVTPFRQRSSIAYSTTSRARLAAPAHPASMPVQYIANHLRMTHIGPAKTWSPHQQPGTLPHPPPHSSPTTPPARAVACWGGLWGWMWSGYGCLTPVKGGCEMVVCVRWRGVYVVLLMLLSSTVVIPSMIYPSPPCGWHARQCTCCNAKCPPLCSLVHLY